MIKVDEFWMNVNTSYVITNSRIIILEEKPFTLGIKKGFMKLQGSFVMLVRAPCQY